MTAMADAMIQEQIAEFEEVFNLFDEDKDNKLSLQELGAVLTALGQEPSEEGLLKMVDSLDREPAAPVTETKNSKRSNKKKEVYVELDDNGYDRNSKINFSEFLSLMAQQIKATDTEDELIESFKVFDRDGDGFINAAELRYSMMNLGEKLMDTEVDDMIQEADRDGDGAINYDEFVKMMVAK